MCILVNIQSQAEHEQYNVQINSKTFRFYLQHKLQWTLQVLRLAVVEQYQSENKIKINTLTTKTDVVAVGCAKWQQEKRFSKAFSLIIFQPCTSFELGMRSLVYVSRTLATRTIVLSFLRCQLAIRSIPPYYPDFKFFL